MNNEYSSFLPQGFITFKDGDSLALLNLFLFKTFNKLNV